MNELALFAGAGGGILGGGLLGCKTVCAVELNAYAASVLVARQNDGCLAPFPIWNDVRTFDGKQWRGVVDLVSGGFPCQPFSTASRGRRVAVDLWPEMFRIIHEVSPYYVLAENVQREPIECAATDLRRIGFRVRVESACPSIFGSPARRPRWWLVAHTNGQSEPRRAIDAQMAGIRPLAGLDWWKNDPRTLGVADGVAYRMDRLKALGNGQVPIMAAGAFANEHGSAEGADGGASNPSPTVE